MELSALPGHISADEDVRAPGHRKFFLLGKRFASRYALSQMPRKAGPDFCRRRPARGWSTAILVAAALGFFQANFLTAAPAEILPPGYRPEGLGIHALAGGRVVIKPGEILEGGTIIIRDGKIDAVGTNLPAPPGARVWRMEGQVIYPGFIDAYFAPAATNAPVRNDVSEPVELSAGSTSFFGVPGEAETPSRPAGYGVPSVRPQQRVSVGLTARGDAFESLRQQGFTAANVVPSNGIFRGTSALTLLGAGRANQTILNPDTFQHLAFETQGGTDDRYPASLMGVLAVIRQTFLDGDAYENRRTNALASAEKPEFNPALAALRPLRARQLTAVFEPGSALMVERAAAVAREFNLRPVILSSGQEWRRPELARAAACPFIVPLNFPDLPRLPNEDDWVDVSLDRLRVWDWAAENPAIIRRAGAEMALTTYGLADKKNFRRNLRLAVARGLSEADAVAALTTIPAKLCGLEARLGTIEKGKLANLTVVQGKNYFDADARIPEVWIEGKIYRLDSEPPGPGGTSTNRPAELRSPEGGDPARSPVTPPPPPPEKTPGKAASPPEKKEEKKPAEWVEQMAKRVAQNPWERPGVLADPGAVLVRGATIWTCGPAGVIPSGDLLVVGGTIAGVGPTGTNFPGLAGRSPMVVDGTGLHLTPGLIDAHSHSMILGSVNEGTLPSTAMVRVDDVVNSETANIYEQLAGGVTAVNLLHGSANPIGGQNCIIKLRHGALPAGLKFTNAPAGIKFALGENVKQSNWGEKNVTRFPQSRMGVATFIANRFQAARNYLEQWDNYRRKGGVEPARNLELETLVEVLQGKRWIHCHSYRQDEILVFLRLMEEFGVKVGTLQHVLEGYKIADEIAAHGAGASTFSDWWAYKFEVIDAIPYNGSLMRDRGVLVSFNSDSSELARRLYLEAAKAVKYGKTPEPEALKFVTCNPAKQLGLEARVGSLEPGKDADFALWSASPLDARTVCLETWIEGKKYFDRRLDPERSSALAAERKALLEKARQVLRSQEKFPARPESSSTLVEEALEHRDDGKERHCLDE